MILAEVVSIIWGKILELFRSIKTTMMDFFYDQYDAPYEATAVAATVTVSVVGRDF